ncbi:sulfotransferase [Sphingosinicella sp. BN140058]|uniref:sulfotransferase family protein n=1 Tax=Sphingosinicella sp. BN140058 TaxID=1892855 RepID=UPI001010C2E3|nr:sulfotransferase [Sphingosinicella sp. BN140058]QAY78038.1 sulfotransferase [Sphingosinicella sp. BN140058]
MTDTLILPDFVIIGAVKGATTWLHGQLQANPGVYLPDPEPHFFSRDYQRGFAFYADFFRGAAPGQLLGEKSADYLAHPQAPARLARALPGVPLVVQLRNPVERAYSDYKMLYRRGTIRGGPELHLTPANRDHRRFLEDGLYAKHLRRWFDHFPRHQIKVLLYEDVRNSPEDTVRSVCRHIGAPEVYSPSSGARRFNDASERFLPLGMRRLLKPLKGAVKPLRNNAMFTRVRGLLAREIAYPPLTPVLRQALMDYYADDVVQLSELIGRELGPWVGIDLAPPRRAAAG